MAVFAVVPFQHVLEDNSQVDFVQRFEVNRKRELSPML
jgi:hypothetical protein